MKRKPGAIFANRVKKTSFLDFGIVRNHHRFFIPLLPLASSNLKLDRSYDLIISSSAGYAKGFNFKNAFHICYCHTPLRYAWEKKLPGRLGFIPNSIVKNASQANPRRSKALG